MKPTSPEANVGYRTKPAEKLPRGDFQFPVHHPQEKVEISECQYYSCAITTCHRETIQFITRKLFRMLPTSGACSTSSIQRTTLSEVLQLKVFSQFPTHPHWVGGVRLLVEALTAAKNTNQEIKDWSRSCSSLQGTRKSNYPHCASATFMQWAVCNQC